jgi:uncharacterized membrane protein
VTAHNLGRLLMVFGLVIAAFGGLIWLLGALPRLPGDIYIQRRGFTLYIPVVGSILVSLLLTLLLNLFFARR